MLNVKTELTVMMRLMVVNLFLNLAFFYSWILIKRYFKYGSITKL